MPRDTVEKNRKTRHRYSEDPIYFLLIKAKSRCNKSGMKFSITKEDLKIPDLCPILKTPFVLKTPYAMSIDRIDNTKGYIPGNVQIISRKGNTMKNDSNIEQLRNFGRWIEETFGLS